MKKQSNKVTARRVVSGIQIITDKAQVQFAKALIKEHLKGNKKSDAKFFNTREGTLLIVAKQFPTVFRQKIMDEFDEEVRKFGSNTWVKDLPRHKQSLRIGIPV